MKKLIYISILFLIFTGIIGCGDNDSFSNLHVLTDDEIAEMHRQDSIDSVNRSRIDADLILEYTIETYATAVWGGADKDLYIDFDKIGTCFGLTAAEVLDGINQEDNAPVIKGYAIQASTHAAVDKASTTNGLWGHWWTTEGDLCDTYNQANSALFCEWQSDHFVLGQFPGNLSEGFNVTFLECLKYQDKKVAIQITFKIVERGEITATIVNTINLSVSMNPRTGYDSDALPFDRAQVLSDLGISSLDDAQIISVNADDSYAQEGTANNGFWYDLDGYPCSYGNNNGIYIEYHGLGSNADPADLDVLYVGQMPNALEVGFNKTFKYAFMANNKIVMLNIAVEITAYQDPETPPAGSPVDIVETLTFTKPYDTDYIAVSEDVKELLRNAFKMTTYQIFSALNSGDLKVYMQTEGTEPAYTGSGAGEYWIDGQGDVTEYATGVLYIGLSASETGLVIAGGNHPDNCNPAGQVITTKMIITCNGAKAVFNITYNVTPAA